jgi:hypothetical protein
MRVQKLFQWVGVGVTLASLMGSFAAFGQAPSNEARVFNPTLWRTQGGQSVTLDTVPKNKRWAALVIDAQRGAPKHLEALNRGEGKSWGQDLVVLAVGPSKDIDALFSIRTDLPSIKLRAVDTATLRNARLPGAPLLIGFDENNKLAWMESNAPKSTQELEQWVSRWIGRPIDLKTE